MPAVASVLIVGAGVAGAGCAILLAERGIAVDVMEVKPDISALGSGITLQGNALRVLRQLGVWECVSAKGYPFDTLGIRAPDQAGTLVAELTELRTGGSDLPATMGMYRPELAKILLDRAATVGAKIRFGTTFTELHPDESGVSVSSTDGITRHYDLVIGADGMHSATRRAVGIELETRPTGLGIWRIFATRPESVTRTDLFYGGASYIAGYCPTGPASMYAYIVEDVQDRSTLSPQERLEVMRDLAANYHGPWDEIRANIKDPELINYARFEWHVLDRPWNRGRVVLVGDAAHTCPPTVAQGAAQALEDAVVLSELLLASTEVSEQLWEDFMDRRFQRAKTVVDASVQIGQWQLDHDPAADVPALMGAITRLVSTPA